MTRTAATLHFSELLLALLKGKTSLADALHILACEGVEKPVRDAAVSLLLLMKKGRSFSESLRSIQDGKVSFGTLYLTLIMAAEITGNVESVLERIENDQRRKQKAKENAVNILIYPAIVILAAVAGTFVLIIKGMPLFISNGLLASYAVPGAKIGICIAGAVLLLGGSLLFTVYFRLFNNDSPEYRIFYLLHFLLQNNVTFPEALSHCIADLGNNKFGRALLNVKKNISSGTSFSAAFAKIPFFSPYVKGWLSVAGMYGNLGEICGNTRDYFAGKDTRKRELASKLIEPAVIMLTGLYVLIIMLTVILPILSFAGGTI